MRVGGGYLTVGRRARLRRATTPHPAGLGSTGGPRPRNALRAASRNRVRKPLIPRWCTKKQEPSPRCTPELFANRGSSRPPVSLRPRLHIEKMDGAARGERHSYLCEVCDSVSHHIESSSHGVRVSVVVRPSPIANNCEPDIRYIRCQGKIRQHSAGNSLPTS
jgi:hypothetical protein